MQRIHLQLDQLVVNPAINPRHASDDDVGDLVAQIKANGYTDAILVRPLGNADNAFQFELIDGSRRNRAQGESIAAGVKELHRAQQRRMEGRERLGRMRRDAANLLAQSLKLEEQIEETFIAETETAIAILNATQSTATADAEAVSGMVNAEKTRMLVDNTIEHHSV